MVKILSLGEVYSTSIDSTIGYENVRNIKNLSKAITILRKF